MDGTTTGDAQAIIDTVEALHGVEEVGLEDNTVLIVPSGKSVHDLKPYLDARRTRPERRKGTARLTTLQSFIEHAVRFADDHSVIFADDSPTAPSLVSVLDYHEQEATGAPRFGQHRGVYAFPVSDEWKAWSKVAQGPLDQAALAAFLEERIVDVLDPAAAGEGTKHFAAELGIALASPARLMDLSRGLTVRVDSKVVNHVNTSTGEAQIGYEENHTDRAGGPLKVPGGFVVAIPVFRAGSLYQIPVRLLYRVQRGEQRVVWSLRPHRAERVFADAFDGAAREAAEATGLPVFFGTPEN